MDLTLFRHSAIRAAGHRLFGEVAIVIPPSGGAAMLVALLALFALAAATCIVEVSQRSRAAGVLMPAGGFVDIVARQPGQVIDVLVSENQLVSKEQLLVSTGDRAYLGGRSASNEILRSLQNEMQLMNSMHARQQEVSVDRLMALSEEMDTAVKQLAIAETRSRSLDNELGILEKRLKRWQELVNGGHVSRDAFELEQAKVFRIRAERAEFQQTLIGLSQAIKTNSRLQTDARNQLDLSGLQNAMNAERLQRDIESGRRDVLHEFRAADQSVVAQVLVQPGDTVRTGQVLLKLRQPGDRLQAWLYLPTSSARLLGTGQSVEISLDAYPKEIYGTHTAVVSSVSGIALLPKDVRAPLLIAGPVFEVKAELVRKGIGTEFGYWPLAPGISFTAEIVQRRLKLYQWLLRLPLDDHGDSYG